MEPRQLLTAVGAGTGTVDPSKPYYFAYTDVTAINNWIADQVNHPGALGGIESNIDFLEGFLTGRDTYSPGVELVINDAANPVHMPDRGELFLKAAQVYRYLDQFPSSALTTRPATDYSNLLINSLDSFYTTYETNVTARSTNWSPLDTALRVDQWVMSYYMLFDKIATVWTGPRRLRMNEMLGLQGDFLYDRATPTTMNVPNQRLTAYEALYTLGKTTTLASYDWNSSGASSATDWKGSIEGKLGSGGEISTFSETSPSAFWRTDGGHFEQSPSYAAVSLTTLLRMAFLEAAGTSSGPLFGPGSQGEDNIVTATDALYSMLDYRGFYPATGDSDRQSGMADFVLSDAYMGTSSAWKHDAPDNQQFMIAFKRQGNLEYTVNQRPDEGRGNEHLIHSGFHMLRGDKTDSQLTFDVGPYGSYGNANASPASGHGQMDLLNIELSAFGRPLITDPGLSTDSTTEREWTSSHNTISVVSGSSYKNQGARGFSNTSPNYNDAAARTYYGADYSDTPAFGGSIVWGASRTYNDVNGGVDAYRTVWSSNTGLYLVADWTTSPSATRVENGFNLPSNATAFNGGYISNFGDLAGNVYVLPVALDSADQPDYAPNRQVTLDGVSGSTRRLRLLDNGTKTAFVTLISTYDTFDENLKVSAADVDTTVGGATEGWITVTVSYTDASGNPATNTVVLNRAKIGSGSGSMATTSIASGPANTATVPALAPAPAATVRSATQVDLTWGDNNNTTETNWRVERSVNGAAFTSLSGLLGASVRTYSDTTAPANSKLAYRIVAIGSGFSTPGDSITLFTPTATTATTLGLLADAYVRAGTSANTNFGSGATVEVRNDAASGSVRRAYFKVDLATVSNLNAAHLRLYGGADTAPISIGVYDVPTTGWVESGTGGITWNNKPPADSTPVATTTVGTTQGWYDWDLTAYLRAKKASGASVVSFMLAVTTPPQTNAPKATFDSKEAGLGHTPGLAITSGGTLSILTGGVTFNDVISTGLVNGNTLWASVNERQASYELEDVANVTVDTGAGNDLLIRYAPPFLPVTFIGGSGSGDYAIDLLEDVISSPS